MRNLLLLPAFIFIAASGNTQENIRIVSLKMYAGLEDVGVEYEKFVRQRTIISSQKGFSFGHFSPALSFSHPKYSHEIELSRLVIGKKDDIRIIDNQDNNLPIPISGEQKTVVDFSIRYEFNYYIKSSSKLFLPQIGIGFQPYFHYSDILPNISGAARLSRILAGNRVCVIPRIVFKAKKNLYFDLNLPLSILDNYYIQEKEQNPLLTIQEMKTSGSGAWFMKNWFHLRIGAGVKL